MSIEAANVTTVDGIAKDIFLFDGKCDIDDLEQQLSGRPVANCNPIARVNAILRRLGFG